MDISCSLEFLALRATDIRPLPAVEHAHAVAAALPSVRLTNEWEDTRAQLDALQRTRRENERAEIMRQIADLQDQNSLTEDEGMGPCFLPLESYFSGVKAKYIRQLHDKDLDPIKVTRLCNGVSIS